MRRGRALVALTAGLAVLAFAGCGSDDFENDPRPPLPLEVSVELGEDSVVVSPAEFGAGITNFTIVNLGDTTAAFAVDGPTSDSTEEIAVGGTATLKTQLETGEYEASAEGTASEPFEFEVGPERDSAQNDLLLP
jgi:hypothetical protein